MASNPYRKPAPATPNLAVPGVGEPMGRPGHPYASGTMPPGPNAPYPRLPEARPGTLPKGGAKIGKGAPPQPSK